MDNLYALIMAGGGGTRLWPLSRQKRPKQMLALVEDRTMFQISVERLSPLLPPERILIVTGSDQVADLQRDTPHIPPENFIVEPFGQNTGPAVGLATVHIQQRDPNAVIAVLTADQHIADKAKFRRVLETAGELALKDYIVTLGISPSFPATGYGYIRRGNLMERINNFQTYHAAGFTEKPDLETAMQFLAAGLYSWNSGMFIYKVGRVLTEYQRQQPEMYALLQSIQAAVGTDTYPEVLDQMWRQMPRLSIDYAIMENAQNMAVIPVDIGWSDIGSWATLFDVLDGDHDGNVIRGQANTHINLDTRNTLIFSDRPVATIGLEDLVIVDTEDVLLVCDRKRSQEVRAVLDTLKQNGREDLL
ncbi:MAG: mannose-1-phosphate guanylyltransferase [Anaerolineae bacterium]|nr:mannose-1-phosphate guanylyltransferase [Anaerolineae bacterium]